jgi:ATP-dependent helicase Lhr and Lhr-like helicase
LWQTRKKAADLLAVAAEQGSFPILLEAYRECLRDVFDMPATLEIARAVTSGEIAVHTVTSKTASPFAAGLLFGYVANYIYEGDAPLAERRAQALSVDEGLLRDLLGEAELRELLDPDAVAALEEELQQLPERFRARSADGVHDLLLRLGDLDEREIGLRSQSPEVARTIHDLVIARRAVEIAIGRRRRFVAAEQASRYRDALGAALPPGLPEAFRRPVADPLGELLLRYARTHGPFPASEPATRYELPIPTVEAALHRLAAAGKLVEGAFRRGGSGREWSDPEVLRQVRRRSLAKLRKEVEPVAPAVLGRFLTRWHGLTERGRGLDAVLDTIEKLQGVPLPASALETEILPARVEGYLPGDLDSLAAAGEIVWVGLSGLGPRDGRVALFLTDNLGRLHRPPVLKDADLSPRETQVLAYLQQAGASFFASVHDGVGGGFPQETVEALWSLVWKGAVTNDTFRALRAFTRSAPSGARRGRQRPRTGGMVLPLGSGCRSRRVAPPSVDGRWSLVTNRAVAGAAPDDTAYAAALAQQLLVRYGLVTREVATAEEIPGGFTALYEVYRTMEETGRIRRGYFVDGVAAMQFGLPPVLEMLRSLRPRPEEPEVITLAAGDPANPYGALLPWPAAEGRTRSPARAVGAHVILVDGALAGWLSRGSRHLLTWLPADEAERARIIRALAAALAALVRTQQDRGGLLIQEIDEARATAHPLADALQAVGFLRTHDGLQIRRTPGTSRAHGLERSA